MEMNKDFKEFAERMQEEILESTRREFGQVLIDHWMHPRNFDKMKNFNGCARMTGPCGDTIEIFILVKNGTINKCTFICDGCGSSTACGSIVTTMAEGKRVQDAKKIKKEEIIEYCGGIPPEYEHCALLATNTLLEAIENYEMDQEW